MPFHVSRLYVDAKHFVKATCQAVYISKILLYIKVTAKPKCSCHAKLSSINQLTSS